MQRRPLPPANLPVADDDLTLMEREQGAAAGAAPRSSSSPPTAGVAFTAAEIENFVRYFNCLRHIVERLITCDGYTFKEGKLRPPDRPGGDENSP